jgi:hypothetical protein
MSRKSARQVVFVCVGITDTHELVSQVIEAKTQQEAAEKFFKQVAISAKDVLGPFYKKKSQVLESIRTLKFSNQTKRCIYNDWVVDAFLLQDPENYAYLNFIKRTDDKKLPYPKGTIVVPVSDLRFI